jgi:Macrocin-O-methyltransferase (TylF).
VSLRSSAKTAAKEIIAPWRYPQPFPQLRTERLYLYLDALHRTRSLPGAVVEVGCFQGATAAYAYRFLRGMGVERRYLCIDTFAGFPRDQFFADVKVGTDSSTEHAFSANSKKLVRKLLNMWGFPEIELLQADVVQLSAAQLPEQVAVALIDVDIAAPTRAALQMIIPRVVSGGIVLVDDCDQGGFKGAGIATEEVAPNARYEFGMGIIEC